jgi:hypothetical protein
LQKLCFLVLFCADQAILRLLEISF